MHRPLLIAAILFLAASLPLSAQHGGGHSSFGGRGGMSAHSSGGRMGFSHASGGMRSASNFAARSRGFSSRRLSSHQPFASRGFNHFRGGRFRSYGFRNNCYGYRCRGRYAYPWWYAGAYDPYWWSDSGSYDQDQQYQIDMANQMNAESLAEQRMREQDNREQDNRGQDNQDVYERNSPRAPMRNAEREVTPATVLVFRDHHQQEVQNYAIVGQTLWIFAPQRTQKIPLSDLDLQATLKANDERGVEFRLPAAQEGE